MTKTEERFQQKYNYKIYKQTSSLSQLLQQAECDAIGIDYREGEMKVYAVDVAFQLLAVGNGIAAHEVLVGLHVAKMMVAAPLGVLGAAHQSRQHVALQGLGLVVVALQLPPAGSEKLSGYSCDAHLTILDLQTFIENIAYSRNLTAKVAESFVISASVDVF
jgi:hypothetical protein